MKSAKISLHYILKSIKKRHYLYYLTTQIIEIDLLQYSAFIFHHYVNLFWFDVNKKVSP